jgi:pimeloyl-ACP methyl ester carboxylesterase
MAHIILVPGLWLDASSWSQVVPHLEAAGHSITAITLPGMNAADADRSSVTLQDHVDAVVAAIDAASTDSVVLVGHSAGCGLVHAAVDARPDRVATAMHIGGFPTPDGQPPVDGLSVIDGEVPLPDWRAFDESDLTDLDDRALELFRDRAIPSPARVTTDPQRLSDDRRYQVPTVAVCSEYTSEMLRDWIDQDMPPVQEFARMRHLTYVDLPTGHWPQLTRPQELAQVILDAIPNST